LTRIESPLFHGSPLHWIEIPWDPRILGSSYFIHCQSFSFIPFESNPRLKRIESSEFPFLSHRLIESPQSIQFMDNLGFSGIDLNPISIENGHERFVIDQGFLIAILDLRFIHSFVSSSSSSITFIHFIWIQFTI
jgi:hypothetical protein